MATAEQKRHALRAGLAADRPMVIVGAHDALSAHLITRAGFDGVWVSGFGVSTMTYAMPDLNLVTMSEALDAARRIDAATSLPVVADCDNGFGGLNNVVRTVQEYERGGIAGICIEDNLFPKRNSLLGSDVRRELLPVEEQARRLAAGKAGQVTDDFVVIARVEALIAGHGVDEAIVRANAYAAAGADAVLIHSRDKTLGEIEAFLAAWEGDVPLVVVPTLFPTFTPEELYGKGIQLVILANQPMRAAVKAMEDTLALLAEHRVASAVDPHIASVGHVFDLVGTRETIEREAAYGEDG